MKAFWVIYCLVRLAGCAGFAEWGAVQLPQEFYGFAIIVEASSGKTKLWVSLMRLGSMTGCHQKNERSFLYKGCQFPLCARCTGLLSGHLVGLLLFVFFLRADIMLLLYFAAISVLLLGIDGIGQLKKLWLSTNLRRLTTGLFCGFFVTVFNLRLILAVIDFVGGI